MDYCRRSANPIGRLVLRVAGYDDPRLDAASDAVCTALQLANFWQDFGRDWRQGRLYVPLEEYDRAGAREADLDAGRIERGLAAGAGGRVRRTRAPVRGGPSRVRRRGRAAAVGAAPDLARRHADPRSARGRRVRRPAPPPGARRARRGTTAVETVAWTHGLHGSHGLTADGAADCRSMEAGLACARHKLLLFVSRAPGREAPGHRGGVGLLPRRG